ncbi:hypothetical protein [Sphingomonas sp. Leaf205]|uniref:hypothetical protein n=1 Tax=Sphingomonas sp. Leaf205 TaxID=2876551 RepID=UPI001E55187E|nr:hypothetical protein [Sphingomonas sp. Leaf205]
MAEVVGLDQTDRVIEALVVNGIVRRQSSIRFQFPFPIVQEYLAATHLIDHGSETLVDRIDDAIQRPWAQVLQFALELHPDPSPIVAAVLAREDDAFSTGLRLVARCIANGAKVDRAQVAEVTDRLVDYWVHAHYDARDRVGQLIFDAFSRPISPRLRAALHNRWLLNGHGAEMIVREASPDLTMSILEMLLRREIECHSFYHSLKPALSALGDAGFDRIIAASQADDLTEDEWAGLDDLLKHFPRGSVSRERAIAAVAEPNLPLDLRLNCARIAGSPLLPEAWTLLVAAISNDELTYWKTSTLLAEMDDRVDRFFALLTDTDIPEKTRFDLASEAGRIFPAADEHAGVIERIVHDPAIDPDIAVIGRLSAARYGDRSMFEALIEGIPTLSPLIVRETLALFGYHPGEALAERAAELVSERPSTPEDVVSFASGADIGMRYVYEMDHGFGGSLRETSPHEGTSVWADLLTRWLDRDDLSDGKRMEIATHAGRLGSESAKRALLGMVLAIGDPDDPRHDDGDGFGQTLRTAVDETRRWYGPIPIELAERLARARRPNVNYAGIAAIEAAGDRAALDLLLRLHGEAAMRGDRGTLEGSIERLASKLSMFVRRRGDVLDMTD